MSPSGFFLTSFIAPILGATAVSGLLFLGRKWMIEHGFSLWVVIFLAFVVTFFIMRAVVHYFVALLCPKCGNKTAYEMDGISSRFRCRMCSKEF